MLVPVERNLPKVVPQWPTPRASDENGPSRPRIMAVIAGDKGKGFQLREAVFVDIVRNGGTVGRGENANPDWVEWLMAYPAGWTYG